MLLYDMLKENFEYFVLDKFNSSYNNSLRSIVDNNTDVAFNPWWDTRVHTNLTNLYVYLILFVSFQWCFPIPVFQDFASSFSAHPKFQSAENECLSSHLT